MVVGGGGGDGEGWFARTSMVSFGRAGDGDECVCVCVSDVVVCVRGDRGGEECVEVSGCVEEGVDDVVGVL